MSPGFFGTGAYTASARRGRNPADEPYGKGHRQLKARWARRVALGGVLCARCGEPIAPGTAWHLDHADDGIGYLGPSHARCNLEAAGRVSRRPRGSREW